MRLITRANIDGVTSAVFVTMMETVEQVVFANPSDLENGGIIPFSGDYIVNLPAHPKAGFWVDHHQVSLEVANDLVNIKGIRAVAPSAARLVYEYYKSPKLSKFEELLIETDRIDSANLTLEDIIDPKEWVLLSYTMDPYEKAPAYHAYVNQLITVIRSEWQIDRILDLPEVKGRVTRYKLDMEDFKAELTESSKMVNKVLVTDFRNNDLIPFGNRFLAFALFQECKVQIRLYDHGELVRFRLGKNPLQSTPELDLGEVASKFGGGGLQGASGFLVSKDDANETLARLVQEFR